eukprot:CAMPEP_0183334908 /NCGR_PEP_ID=MMETSP0164_2-20130417/3371_1 /TAXON_ID=221442 /ORGANISM="Coccolithus pelagicus ssp braarudi, Strain PLY182g" /LENGTH=164 /DNA_ID=CAMNT_0025504149 /DNA_START=66 /DNA_END=557 /DNA_ORIENTATION=+
MSEAKQQEGRNLILACDGSKYTEHAIDWCVEKFFRKTDKITLLHVFDFHPVTTMDLYGSVSVANMNVELEKKGEEHAVSMLKKHAQHLMKHGYKPHVTVLKGPAKHSIVEYVESKNADVLLIASRGLGAVKRFFLGSVSDFCVHNSKCPVVVIKDTLDDTSDAK